MKKSKNFEKFEISFLKKFSKIDLPNQREPREIAYLKSMLLLFPKNKQRTMGAFSRGRPGLDSKI